MTCIYARMLYMDSRSWLTEFVICRWLIEFANVELICRWRVYMHVYYICMHVLISGHARETTHSNMCVYIYIWARVWHTHVQHMYVQIHVYVFCGIWPLKTRHPVSLRHSVLWLLRWDMVTIRKWPHPKRRSTVDSRYRIDHSQQMVNSIYCHF